MTNATPRTESTRKPRTILALESSCDDTAAAIVRDGREVLASVRLSQTALHATFGGVVPEAAARAHIVAVNDVVADALQTARLGLEDIDAFAATLGPGLIGSLLVGANTAKTLSLLSGKPFLGVHHLYGHVASNYLESDLSPPFLCLLVSGGHTQLVVVDDWDSMRIVGQTLDDAAGEAYDKVARSIGLPYPGGPVIDQLALTGDPKRFKLPIAQTEGAYDFSFSGLKTATLRAFEKASFLLSPSTGLQEGSSPEFKSLQADMSASFQHTAIKTLLDKTVLCAQGLGIKTITIAGGVSANRGLRGRFEAWCGSNPGYRLYVPKMAYCTDNAAMIAASAFFNPITSELGQEVFSRGMPVGSKTLPI